MPRVLRVADNLVDFEVVDEPIEEKNVAKAPWKYQVMAVTAVSKGSSLLAVSREWGRTRVSEDLNNQEKYEDQCRWKGDREE
eukprot:200088-Hanusia_phi.AAC.1